MTWFAVASLCPALLLALGALYGGVFPLLALLSLSLLVPGCDTARTAPASKSSAPEDRPAERAASGLALCLVLGGVHLGLLPLIVQAVATRSELGWDGRFILLLAAGLWFGQVSHANAHDLIHRPDRRARLLGRVLYASLLYGHHETAHLRVHHVHAATDADPNSARLGETFWAFLPRCALGEIRAGWRAENAARASARPPKAVLSHPYLHHAALSALSLGMAFALGGVAGLCGLLVLAVHAAMQLMLADYVQHYGLRRRCPAQGRPEPVGPQHAWNAPHWYSSAMMLNAPRHSEHHMRPQRPFPALSVDSETMPVLPHGLPVMAAIALVPPVWHRMMDPRVRLWRAEPACAPPARQDAAFLRKTLA